MIRARRELNGDRAAQVFLHYVDQTGPYAEWKFDKRNGIPSHQAFRDDPISKQAKLFSWLTEPSRKNRPQ